jgi:hypothetical protein
MTRTRLELLQWYGLFGGALAWTGLHVIGYGIADASCNVVNAHWGLDRVTWETVLTVLAAAGVIAAAAAAYLAFRETENTDEDAPGPIGRIRFFSEAALLGNVLFFVIVVLDGVSSAYHSCRPS